MSALIKGLRYPRFKLQDDHYSSFFRGDKDLDGLLNDAKSIPLDVFGNNQISFILGKGQLSFVYVKGLRPFFEAHKPPAKSYAGFRQNQHEYDTFMQSASIGFANMTTNHETVGFLLPRLNYEIPIPKPSSVAPKREVTLEQTFRIWSNYISEIQRIYFNAGYVLITEQVFQLSTLLKISNTKYGLNQVPGHLRDQYWIRLMHRCEELILQGVSFPVALTSIVYTVDLEEFRTPEFVFSIEELKQLNDLPYSYLIELFKSLSNKK